jgi:hypothetical protein
MPSARLRNIYAVAVNLEGAVSMKYGPMFLCAAATAACLHFANTAQAGLVYHGDFDPPLYVGTVFVDVDPGCVLGTGWKDVVATSCGPVNILSLVVNSAPPGDQLVFAPAALVGKVTGLYWVGGVLTAIDTVLIGPQQSGPTPGGYFDLFGPSNDFAIQFLSNHANPEPRPIANLFNCTDGCGPNQLLPVGKDPARQQAFVQVPEPASLGLVLGALGAGWLARRRKAKA